MRTGAEPPPYRFAAAAAVVVALVVCRSVVRGPPKTGLTGWSAPTPYSGPPVSRGWGRLDWVEHQLDRVRARCDEDRPRFRDLVFVRARESGTPALFGRMHTGGARRDLGLRFLTCEDVVVFEHRDVRSWTFQELMDEFR